MSKRTLKVTTGDGGCFYSRDWSQELIGQYEIMADKRFNGIKKMELVDMSDEEYKAIPATNCSAQLFCL